MPERSSASQVVTSQGTRNAMTVFIDKSKTVTGTAKDRKFSLSDEYDGYPMGTEIPEGDGFFYSAAKTSLDDEPERTITEKGRFTEADRDSIRTQDGITRNFRYVRLQRLANPLLKWNAVTNPYLTIDSMEADLVTINGADAEDSSLPPAADGTQAVSHEKGDANRALWGFQRSSTVRTPMGPNGVEAVASAGHNYALAFDESLGQTNDLFEPEDTSNTTPFAWLTWNNRPFVSHMEIMNVPYLASDRLTYSPEAGIDPSHLNQPFTIDDDTVEDPYGGSGGGDGDGDNDAGSMTTRPGALAGRYGHLLNFFASEDDSTDNVLDAYKLLEYIEVPSRFVNNESYFLPSGSGVLAHPFNTISHYRAPGLINLNTIPPSTDTTSTVWNAVISEEVSGQIPWQNFKNSIYGQAAEPTGPSDFVNPFRPSSAANLLPRLASDNDKVTGAACTLMRPVSIDDTSQGPLFDYTMGSVADDPTRSAAFRNSVRTRLGNMVTTKSSVFACWITVGYFEVDEDGNLIDNEDPEQRLVPEGNVNPTMLEVDPGKVAEIGADTGEQVRNRAFFIFDRSIPVAFEPGKNHNVDKAILIKSIIE